MNGAPAKQSPRSMQPALRVLLAILLAASVTGFFVGLRQSRRASQQEAVYGRDGDNGAQANDIPVAVGYHQQPARRLGPNRDWRGDLKTLRQPAPPPPPKTPASAEARGKILLDRAVRRAFDGAPPIIPHPTLALGVTTCLACHEHGIMVGERRAAKMSHPLYVNCTQCHVEVTQPDGKEAWQNTFTPLPPTAVETAFSGAPPAVPHSIWMRDDCQSCHGVAGPAALRTTHPERQNCIQCHALSSAPDLPPRSATALSDRYGQVKSPAKEKK